MPSKILISAGRIPRRLLRYDRWISPKRYLAACRGVFDGSHRCSRVKLLHWIVFQSSSVANGRRCVDSMKEGGFFFIMPLSSKKSSILSLSADAPIFKHRKLDMIRVIIDHRQLLDVQLGFCTVQIYLVFLARKIVFLFEIASNWCNF